MGKYSLHTASSLLKLKSKFHNSKLKYIEKDLDEWILSLERLQILMNEFRQKGNITDEDFMIHVLNNFPKECDVVLNGVKNCLMASGDDVLTIDVTCKKLNHWCKKIIIKNEEKREKEKALDAYSKQYKQRCCSMATNLLIVNVRRIK